jgi:uncharacterized cupin superfamily protein
MPKIDIAHAPRFKGASYPPPFDLPCREREGIRLGNTAGLTQFGVNIMTLKPGVWASQRHWHAREDEFVYVITGELVLIEDGGEIILQPGDCAAWPAGIRDGHHLVNRSTVPASFLVVGSRRDDDWGEYPDIDLRFNADRYSGRRQGPGFAHKDGTPY